MPRSTTLATFFCFATFVLLLFASLSPVWDAVSFLDVGDRHYGIFGPTGGDQTIRYHFQGDGDNRAIYNLTGALILHPIAAGLALLAFICALLSNCALHRVFGFLAAIFIAPAFFLTALVFIFDMAIFNYARNAYRRNGINADLGPANWLTLGALVASFFGLVFAISSIFGRSTRKVQREGARY